MERKKNLLRIFALCMFNMAGIAAFGQKQYSSEIYSAYINGDIARWEQVIGDMERSGTPTTASKLELAEYYYAHIGYLLGSGRKKEAGAYIEKGNDLVDGILKENPSSATATSLKGVFVAYKMEMNKIKAPVLGPQCMKLIKKAYQMDSRNVLAVSDLGNMYYHCPTVFGGDKTLGLQYLRQAAGLMEERAQDKGNWFYLNLLTMIAQYEAESGARNAARETYEKILRIEPGFKWVRDELYPQLVSRM